MRILTICVLAIAFSVSGARTWSEEGSASIDIQLPREGFSVRAPADWKIHQYGSEVLKLTHGKAVLWVRRAQGGGPEARLAAKAKGATSRAAGGREPGPTPWDVAGSTEASHLAFETGHQICTFGTIAVPKGPGFDVETRIPRGATGLNTVVQEMLGSVSVRPFEHPTRHVDWRDGWTLEVPSDWTRQQDAEGIARFRSTGSPACGIRVHARAADEEATPAAAARELVDAALLRLKAKGIHVALEQETLRAGELKLKSGAAARRVTVAARGTRGRAAGLRIQLEAVATPSLRLLIACPGTDASVLAAGRKVALTLRKGTHPGPRVGAVVRQGFKRKGAPPVQFVVPEGWKFEEVESPMRLATLEVPGTPSLKAIVYWFGAGKGGDLAANLARWKSQVRGDSAPKEETIDVAPHVRATILDTHGMYVPDMRPGAGHPDVARGQRLLATFLAVPHGPLFVKLTGPVDAVGKIAGAYGIWIRSFRTVKPGAKPK